MHCFEHALSLTDGFHELVKILTRLELPFSNEIRRRSHNYRNVRGRTHDPFCV